jgi:diacylglycerol kinase (ATP)
MLTVEILPISSATGKVLVILNPASHSGVAAAAGREISEYADQRGVELEIRESKRPGHGEVLATEGVEQGWPIVAAAGGDGTIHEVANGILKTDNDTTVFGMIPIGTGNDYSKTVGVPSGNVGKAMDLIAAGRTRSFDVGRAIGKYFVNSLGVGFGPTVIQHIDGKKSGSGQIPYLKGIVGAFWGFKPQYIEVVADGPVVAEPVMLVEVTLGPTVGGGMILNPGADPTDGMADVCVIGEIGTLKFLRYLPSAVRGKHTKLPQVTTARAREIEIRTAGESAVVHMDGELHTASDGIVQIEIMKQLFPVLC